MKNKGFIALLLCFSLLLCFAACKEKGAEVSSLVEESSSNVSETASVSSKVSNTTSKPKTSSKKQTITSSEETKVELTQREIILNGDDPDLYRFGLEIEGNSTRIANLMKKAQNGGSYTIGILGGSISGGAGATSNENKYANLVFEWWKKTFPKAKFTLVNASIGSANPQMACYRVETDLLKHKPDFVIIDFAVNTYLDENPETTYANLLYRILTQSNNPGVLAINFTAVTPKSYEDWTFKKLEEYPDYRLKYPLMKYEIPTVSYNNYIWKALVKADEFGGEVINWKDVAADYIHPNNNGHKIAAKLIIAHLNAVKKKLSSISSTLSNVPKLDDETYLNVKYLTNTTSDTTKTGGVELGANDHPARRGWSFKAGNVGKLTVPLPTHSEVLLFMSFAANSEGDITIIDANGNKQYIMFEDAKTPTLINLSSLGASITIDSSGLTQGSCDIYGICINP